MLLGVSERGGRNETPEIEGKIPSELKGSLYRNGPGLFERGELRKPHLLDGDGLVQRLSFTDGTAHYQNAFVRTPKFIAEEKADAFRSATGRCGVQAVSSPIWAAVRRVPRLALPSIRSKTFSMLSMSSVRPSGLIPKRCKRWASRFWAIRL